MIADIPKLNLEDNESKRVLQRLRREIIINEIVKLSKFLSCFWQKQR